MTRRGDEPRARRGAARATRERETLRVNRYAQRLEREGRAPTPPPARTTQTAPASWYEADVVPGLEEFATAELRRLLGGRLSVRPGAQAGTLAFQTRADPSVMSRLGTVAAVYQVHRFEVPRPRALLGEEHLYTLLGLIRSVIASHRQESFRSFRISAAGVTSAIFQRLSEELARRTGLRPDREDGDLLIRIRRAPPPAGRTSSAAAEPAFEALLRLTPRPLSARSWRVANLPGALNATVARVMAELTGPASHDRFLNLTCGSATLMIERLELGPARLVVGGDRDPTALDSARRNFEAAGFQNRASLVRWDAGRLPLRDGVMTALCADLPFGMLVGSRRENERLYPELLAEATRVAAPGAAMVLITQSIPLLQKSLEPHRLHWSVERSFEVQLSYQSGVLRPQVFLLRRSHRR